MATISDLIGRELRRQVAERLAELARLNRLLRDVARPSERGGADDHDDDQAASR